MLQHHPSEFVDGAALHLGGLELEIALDYYTQKCV